MGQVEARIAAPRWLRFVSAISSPPGTWCQGMGNHHAAPHTCSWQRRGDMWGNRKDSSRSHEPIVMVVYCNRPAFFSVSGLLGLGYYTHTLLHLVKTTLALQRNLPTGGPPQHAHELACTELGRGGGERSYYCRVLLCASNSNGFVGRWPWPRPRKYK